MTKETLETTNKLTIPNWWQEDKSHEIFESLESISDEEIMEAWEEIENTQKQLDRQQELKDSDKKSNEEMNSISEESKRKVLEDTSEWDNELLKDKKGTGTRKPSTKDMIDFFSKINDDPGSIYPSI